jgi:putative phosphoribosyl transferase
MRPRFTDRMEAGRRLALALSSYAGRADAIVLGLPRGGVPVAFEVARVLGVPLDVFIVRKLGVPGQEEFAMGAIASGGARIIDSALVRDLGISSAEIDAVTQAEMRELERRERQYRDDRPFPELAGRTAIVVDDGLATGASMRVAVAALRGEHPARIVVAVPVAPWETCEALRQVADDVRSRQSPSTRWASGTRTFGRRATRKFTTCSSVRATSRLSRRRRVVRLAVQGVRALEFDGSRGQSP